MATHKSLTELMKQDFNKVAKAAGFNKVDLKDFINNKPKQMYDMLTNAFEEKEVQKYLKKMVPVGVSIEIGSQKEALRFVITYADKKGVEKIVTKDALSDILKSLEEGVKNGKKKCCGKCAKTGKTCKKSSRKPS